MNAHDAILTLRISGRIAPASCSTSAIVWPQRCKCKLSLVFLAIALPESNLTCRAVAEPKVEPSDIKNQRLAMRPK
jgi:hypothetical protein